ncbi:ParB-like nuclease domain-containing protein [Pseudomonas sp. NFPP33]|nr:ParB/RepB/Spo0J family partition protein [Pseudomonas sp. NFPP33]AGH89227.1 ParB-like partitioning protein [uncultured bacterium]SDA85252.1 ParB-like nuclease domain-containing protein [Pseudomonas sp. NFPP33]
MTADTKDKKPAAKKPAAKPAAKKPTTGAFDGLADMLNAGDLGALTSDNGQDFSMIVIAEIAVKAQVREIFEDAENSLDDLAESIREHGVFQPIIIRPIPGPIPFELVAGERRLRASIIAGKEQIPAMVRELTDEQAEAIQFAENIQRKNLTQIETAKRLQRDLDELGGDVEALMAKRQKSRAWISKWLSILDLPEQAQRVIEENVSADPEVILAVKQVEKVSPAAAKELVDDLKQGRGKKGENARDKAQAAKDAVKPPKKPRKEKTPPANPDNVATPKDRSHEEPGPVTSVTLGDVAPSAFQQLNQAIQDENAGQEEQGGSNSMLDDIFADAKNVTIEGPNEVLLPGQQEATQEAAGSGNGFDKEASNVPALPPAEALDNAYSLVFESGSSPKMVLDCMNKDARENCENWLNSFYEVGTSAKDVGRAVIQGFRTGQFAQEGHGAFALAAFLYGADTDAKFSMLDIIGSVKA